MTSNLSIRFNDKYLMKYHSERIAVFQLTDRLSKVLLTRSQANTQPSSEGADCLLYLELPWFLFFGGFAGSDLLQLLFQGLQALLQFLLKVGREQERRHLELVDTSTP